MPKDIQKKNAAFIIHIEIHKWNDWLYVSKFVDPLQNRKQRNNKPTNIFHIFLSNKAAKGENETIKHYRTKRYRPREKIKLIYSNYSPKISHIFVVNLQETEKKMRSPKFLSRNQQKYMEFLLACFRFVLAFILGSFSLFLSSSFTCSLFFLAEHSFQWATSQPDLPSVIMDSA